MTVIYLMLARLPAAGLESFEAYRADPDRAGATPLLMSSGADIELLAVRDVG